MGLAGLALVADGSCGPPSGQNGRAYNGAAGFQVPEP